jgi:hypothetical protein
MGNTTSNNKIYKGVFGKELENINKITNNILSSNDLFRDNRFNMFLKGRCDEQTIFFEKKLNKYPKIHLQNLNEYIYLVPNNLLNKKELCHEISVHYTQILQLIHTIKYITDLENEGDMSIAGILFRNIVFIDDLIQIGYCSDQQEELNFMNKGVDFDNLSGFKLFTKYILSKNEKKLFLKQLSEIFNNNDKTNLKKLFCGERRKDYEKILNIQCGGSSLIKINPNNPVLSWNLCINSKTHVSKRNYEINKSINNFKTNYRNNINNLFNVLNSLVYEKDDTFYLKEINANELQIIKNKLKECVKLFFVTSIVDYKSVFNIVKKSSI